MGRSVRLRAEDMRFMLRLMGEVRELGDDRNAWRTRLLEGLRELLDAPIGYSGQMALPMSGIDADPQVEVGWDRWEDGDPIRALWKSNYILEHDPFFRRAFAIFSTHPDVYLRRDLASDEQFYGAEHNQDVCRPLDMEIGVTSYQRVGDGRSIDALALTTPWQRPMDERARLIMMLIHEQVAPLIGHVLAARDQPTAADLSTRKRQVLELMLEGLADKQIARELKLSRYTVNDYVKDIHRHFGVSSRTELIALFLRRHRKAKTHANGSTDGDA